MTKNNYRMASAMKNLNDYDPATIPSAENLKFGIVVSEWNQEITHALYEGCYETLVKHDVKEEHIYTVQVPGAFELPAGARMLAGAENCDAIICLGCVIQGETKHNEYINNAVAGGLVNLSLASRRPCIYGVLTPNNEQQAKDRAGGKHGNKGVEAAQTAIRMAHLRKKIGKGGKKTIGF